MNLRRVHSRMSQTPQEVQAEAKRRLLAAEGMTKTAEWLRSQGYNVSRSGLGRWWKGCASEDEAIERACREAKAWIAAHGEDAGLVMGSGNAMRVQQVLSDWIAAGRLDPEQMKPKDILSALSGLMNAQARVASSHLGYLNREDKQKLAEKIADGIAGDKEFANLGEAERRKRAFDMAMGVFVGG